MLVPVEWLRSFLEGGGPEEARLAEVLTLIGLEIEGIEGSGDDRVFEVNVTPNRPDALNVLGLAREVVAAGEAFLAPPPEREIRSADEDAGVRIVVDDPDLCPRYAGRVLSNVRLGESPAWMRRRLERAGIRPINNVVDVTNYVLIERGHPLHGFDLEQLDGRMIRVARAGDVKTFATLDAVERELDPDMLMIWDGARPVAVAGVMGGLNSEVTEATSEVLLESAYFEPTSVRRTSRMLGLKTEASFRFERGTDVEGLIAALDEATALLVELAGAEVIGPRLDAYPTPYVPPEITVRAARVNGLLGLSLDVAAMKTILGRLGFAVRNGAAEETLITVPPTSRRDVTGEADIAEEVGRLHGYDKIAVIEPGVSAEGGRRDPRRLLKARMRRAFLARGLSEAVNYSFMNPGDLDRLRVPGGDERWSYTVIRNPIRVEDVAMRTTLAPGLLHNLARNLHHGADGVALFEMGRVYFKGNGNGALPEERETAGIVLRSGSAPPLYPMPAGTFFIGKGILESVLEDLRVEDLEFVPAADEAGYHPGRTARILVQGERVGAIGQVHPEVLERWDVKGEAVMAEIDLGTLLGLVPLHTRFEAIPRFPSMERDVALVLKRDVAARDVEKAFAQGAEHLVESVRLFDVYEGKGVPEGQKSLAYRICYRLPDRTLTADEVDRTHETLVNDVLARFNARLRG